MPAHAACKSAHRLLHCPCYQSLMQKLSRHWRLLHRSSHISLWTFLHTAVDHVRYAAAHMTLADAQLYIHSATRCRLSPSDQCSGTLPPPHSGPVMLQPSSGVLSTSTILRKATSAEALVQECTGISRRNRRTVLNLADHVQHLLRNAQPLCISRQHKPPAQIMPH